nr:helix-turn-helix domain-containing protein [Sphingomonas sp. Y57]
MNQDDAIARAQRAKNGSPYLNSDQAAAYLKLSARSFRRLRKAKKGPPFRRHGRGFLYHIDDLERWSGERTNKDFEA